MIPGKAKLWRCQFALLPRVLRQLLVYEVAITKVERMQQMMNVYYRKWLGVLRMLSDTAVFCRLGKLRLPLMSIVEEIKASKVRLVMIMRESGYTTVAQTRPLIRSGRKRRRKPRLKPFYRRSGKRFWVQCRLVGGHLSSANEAVVQHTGSEG